MTLQRIGEKALIAVKETEAPSVKIRPKKNVLDEDTYTEEVEKIVERDFYPDLTTLKAKAEYLVALESNDKEKLRAIHIKYGPKRGSSKTPSIYDTPATFETPEHHNSNTSTVNESVLNKGESDQSKLDPTSNPEKPKEKEHTLDKFLAKNTSEDNASFNDIMVESEMKDRLKNSWLYDQVQVHQQEHSVNLALPSVEEQAEPKALTSSLQNWKYTIKNQLMYIPEGTDENIKEKVEKKAKPRAILHQNTRFTSNPFNVVKSQQTIAEAASSQALTLQGKIGHDGKEIVPQDTPKVNGYGFLATPSPAPGVGESPMMTWGEIDGTPFRLDGSDTPRVHDLPGPIFKIPDVPRRDQIGFDLAERASKAHRAKKQTALKHVTSKLSTPYPKFGKTSSTERVQSMSPAAQKLIGSRLGVRTHTDKALRASYSPSPSHRGPGEKTPVSLNSKGKGTTPTPGSTIPPSSRTPNASNITPKRQSSALLTDNLLDLTKKKKVPTATLR